MHTYARWAVAAIAIVVAVGGAAYVLAPAGGTNGGPPPPTPSPASSPSVPASATPRAPTPRPSPSPSILATEGFVFPGTYTSAFDPPLTFTIDKEVEHNCAPGFSCRGSIDVNVAGWTSLEFGQPRIEVQILRVDKVHDPAHTGALIDPPANFAAWIGSRPGVTVIAQRVAQVGGVAATRLDVRTGAKGVEFGPIPGVTDPGLGLGANWVARLFVVPVHGRQVFIALHAEDGSLEELQPLVNSIVWR